MNRPKVCACLLVLLVLCLTWRVEGQTSNPSARFPESRSYSPGKMWLEWNSSERIGFIRGFIVGDDDGYRRACNVATTNESQSSVATGVGPCLEKRPLFKKDIGYYEKFVTDYYTRYSEDRDAPVRVILLQADQKTPEEVHQWLAKKSE